MVRLVSSPSVNEVRAMSFEVERKWTTKAGLEAACLLVNDGSHRCGYVRVPPGHPLHGVHYNEHCPALAAAWEKAKEGPIGDRSPIAVFIACGAPEEARPDVVFEVHGGITYADGKKDYPVDDDADGWWFGFDCAHYGDVSRGMFGRDDGGHWWEQAEVEEQCEKLADQIVNIFPLR
jgi:hypothetical protein